MSQGSEAGEQGSDVGERRSDITERRSDITEHRRLRLALSLLIIGFVAVSVAWLGDPRAASFSDAGGRLATVKTMADEGRWVPDIGYWAAPVDVEGLHHPILFTTPHGAHWVEVTSVPLVVVGRPLWQLGGARAAVLLSVLSVVLAAYAARRLSRWASGGEGWLALWFVGLLSPVLFYGADFREHAPALAFGLMAVALLLEGGGRRALLGGLLAGLAAVMRNDMLVTFAALALAALLVTEERRRTFDRWRELAVGAAACVATLIANVLLWRDLFGSVGGSVRASKRAEVAGLHVAERARDAVITSFGVLANEYWLALMIGVVIGIGILLMAAAATDRSETASMTGVVGAIVAWGGLAWRFVAFGISTVPGFIAAAPVAALGLFGERNRREQVLWTGALVAIPAIWMTEWVGGHAPQWGGRYLLLPTTLLMVLAAAAGAPARPPAARRRGCRTRCSDECRCGDVAHPAHAGDHAVRAGRGRGPG